MVRNVCFEGTEVMYVDLKTMFFVTLLDEKFLPQLSTRRQTYISTSDGEEKESGSGIPTGFPE